MGSDLSLTHAFELVLHAWREMCARDEMSEQTFDKFGLLLRRFRRYVTVRGALLVSDVRPDITEDFINAKGRNRHGHVSESAVATRLIRRSVVRTAFRTMRELGLSDQDPTRDIVLPARTHEGVRALSEDEAVLLRHHAAYAVRPTRHAAAAALALAGGHSGEIGHIVVADLDLPHRRVWMHGARKYDPRWCRLDAWGRHVLAERARHVITQHPDKASARLAVSCRPANDAALQSRVCVALRDLLRKVGLDGEAEVTPASVTARAAVEAFEATGRIEESARRLGVRSLDRAAAVVGYDWQCDPRCSDGGPADA
ncbi:integrase/recombinase XerC [Streptomyces sp. Ag109_G2-6]|uniref:integrase n=1 Tax=Streptomyces sp. Ag109_G2-6 TaxID=2485154 RepID=UPI000F4EE74A|nr:integrase [Streptomyces sp. Ag109_G2-6]RPF41120.1 integrase/recombinase XerC [Streptomyces sp. Ag109_G2-6]